MSVIRALHVVLTHRLREIETTIAREQDPLAVEALWRARKRVYRLLVVFVLPRKKKGG